MVMETGNIAHSESGQLGHTKSAHVAPPPKHAERVREEVSVCRLLPTFLCWGEAQTGNHIHVCLQHTIRHGLVHLRRHFQKKNSGYYRHQFFKLEVFFLEHWKTKSETLNFFFLHSQQLQTPPKWNPAHSPTNPFSSKNACGFSASIHCLQVLPGFRSTRKWGVSPHKSWSPYRLTYHSLFCRSRMFSAITKVRLNNSAYPRDCKVLDWSFTELAACDVEHSLPGTNHQPVWKDWCQFYFSGFSIGGVRIVSNWDRTQIELNGRGLKTREKPWAGPLGTTYFGVVVGSWALTHLRARAEKHRLWVLQRHLLRLRQGLYWGSRKEWKDESQGNSGDS